MGIFMVILIDHYDSFSDMIKDYVAQLGFEVLMIRTDHVDPNRIKHYQPSHIILGPGPGHPNDSSLQVLHHVIKAFEKTCPILGICLGHQVIASYYGAKIICSSEVMHGKVSKIQHNHSPLFSGLPDEFYVTRYHSLTVNPEGFPNKKLVLSAKHINADESVEVMALQHQKLPIYGVQFHPEAILTEHGLEVFRSFLSNSK